MPHLATIIISCSVSLLAMLMASAASRICGHRQTHPCAWVASCCGRLDGLLAIRQSSAGLHATSAPAPAFLPAPLPCRLTSSPLQTLSSTRSSLSLQDRHTTGLAATDKGRL